MTQSHDGKMPIDPTPPNMPKVDEAGNPVEVVRKDMEQPNPATQAVDKVLTPTSIKTKEQEAEEINRRAADLERKVRD